MFPAAPVTATRIGEDVILDPQYVLPRKSAQAVSGIFWRSELRKLWKEACGSANVQKGNCRAVGARFKAPNGVSCFMTVTTGGQTFASKRLDREWRTVSAMIAIYCAGRHRSGAALCSECQQLKDYAYIRLQRCVFGETKPTCAKCAVHCYQPARREEMREVMRYAGPRMLLKHPLLTVLHWMDALGAAPEKPSCSGNS